MYFLSIRFVHSSSLGTTPNAQHEPQLLGLYVQRPWPQRLALDSLGLRISPGNVDLEPTANLSLTTSGSVGQQAAPAARGTGRASKRMGRAGGQRWHGQELRKSPEDTPPLHQGSSKNSAVLPWACFLTANVPLGLSHAEQQSPF